MNIDKEREALLKKYLTNDGFISVCVIPHIVRDLSALDEQKAGPSDADVLSLAYDVGAMPEQMTDAGLKRFARALLSKYTAPAPKGEPVRWLHVLYSEHDDPIQEKVSRAKKNPFGKPGIDYSRAYRVIAEPLYAAPVNEQYAKDFADPLQGAADWLVKALAKPRPTEIAARLLIGYNRAERLYDAAIAQQGKGE